MLRLPSQAHTVNDGLHRRKRLAAVIDNIEFCPMKRDGDCCSHDCLLKFFEETPQMGRLWSFEPVQDRLPVLDIPENTTAANADPWKMGKKIRRVCRVAFPPEGGSKLRQTDYPHTACHVK
jgi:hypothetical protein